MNEGFVVTDLIDQVVQVRVPTEGYPLHFEFGRVRAVYVGDGKLRLVVLLTTGYLVEIPAHNCKIKKLKDDGAACEYEGAT